MSSWLQSYEEHRVCCRVPTLIVPHHRHRHRSRRISLSLAKHSQSVRQRKPTRLIFGRFSLFEGVIGKTVIYVHLMPIAHTIAPTLFSEVLKSEPLPSYSYAFDMRCMLQPSS